MTNTNILHADMLDILFEHRNKLYGAYIIRKTYNKRLSLSLLITLGVISVVLFSSFFKQHHCGRSTIQARADTVILTVVEIPHEPPTPARPEHKPQIATSDYRPIVVVPDPLADLPITEVAALDSTEIDTENRNGFPAGDTARTMETNHNAGITNDDSDIKKTGFMEPDERQPLFPGGTEAWLSFLRRFLQAPEDLEPGQRIDVLVRFWVDADGSVSRPEIIKSGGQAFDHEVLRVLKKMPHWEPAVQNGRKVAVAYTQPVSFVGVEE